MTKLKNETRLENRPFLKSPTGIKGLDEITAPGPLCVLVMGDKVDMVPTLVGEPIF